MVEVTVSERAWENLQSICQYIALDSERHAALFVENVFQRIEILHLLPRAGRVVPEYQVETVRELIYGSYRIVYEILSESEISILLIVHGSRLLKL